jgi:iron complex outermembrane receptor protein
MRTLAGAILAAAAFTVQVAAQTGVTLSGRLLDSLSGDPIAGATVQIDELKRQTVSGADGAFRFDGVLPGTYHVSVHAQGYSTRPTETRVGTAAGPPADIAVDPELHFEEVVSVTADPRSQFETFQPTAVLAGQELTKQVQMSLGATLENQPGMSSRSFGPAPARPVIRGLDGDRVLILQDGQRMGDLSSQSGDHGVTVNPAAARRIEVVRGPATLLYGANAIGGLVNVITEDIPTKPVRGVSGTTTIDLGTVAREAGGATDVRIGNGTVAVHAGGGGRRSGLVGTPDGDILNSQSRSGFGSVGLAWTAAKGYFGGSYAYDDSKYGVPVVEEGRVQLTPRRHSFSLRGGGQNLSGAFDSLRSTLTVRRYAHDELEGTAVGTHFTNDTAELEVMGAHKAVGRMKGTIGFWGLGRAFGASGEEALSPDVDQRAVAAFFYEEVTWPHVSIQLGGRVDHTRYEPAGEAERRFTSGSGSVGLLFTPPAAKERLTVAVSLARAARNPAIEELFYLGPHPGNFAFEIGNPGLEPEHALGFDLSVRWRGARASGEVTYFRNDVRRYVFRAPVSVADFFSRGDEIGDRFPGRVIDEAALDEFPIVEHVSADSVLQGVEAHADFGLTSNLFAELGFDYVRGTLRASGDPLPRMPPRRVRGGLRYQRHAFQAGGDVTAAAGQARVFEDEEPTDGYGLLRLFASYSFGAGRVVNTITGRLENATDTLYRNHLSLIKTLAPEAGRTVKLLYGVGF